MQKLPDFLPALSHHLKPPIRDGSQSTCMLFHSRIDGGIALDSAVESQKLRPHRCYSFRSRDLQLRSILASLQRARFGAWTVVSTGTSRRTADQTTLDYFRIARLPETAHLLLARLARSNLPQVAPCILYHGPPVPVGKV
jgi:hypothetical protein